MVVLRIKEYENGDVCLEYRMTRRQRSMTISNKEISLSSYSYHYLKLGTFGEEGDYIAVSNDSGDDGRNLDLIRALSEMGENSITDFTIEIAVAHDEHLEAQIKKVMRLFCLDPENILLARLDPNN